MPLNSCRSSSAPGRSLTRRAALSPAFVIVRQALDDDEVDGVVMRKGSLILVAPWILPFGVGPRICLGAPFALTELVLATATLVRAFRNPVGSASPSHAGRAGHAAAVDAAALPADLARLRLICNNGRETAAPTRRRVDFFVANCRRVA